jgi:hypothetical protein
MAKMSLNEAAKATETVEAVVTTEAVKQTLTTETVKPLKEELAVSKTSAVSGIEGEVERGDIQLPRLNLVQKTSELVNQGFMPNSFVLNKEIPLGKTVELVVVHLKKQFQQDLPYGSDVQPHTCDTLTEVRDAGGSTEWGADNKYSEIAHMQLLVKAPADLPEDALDFFPYEVDGSHWAPCMFTSAKTAYKTSAKPVITAAFSTLRGGLHQGLWSAVAEVKSNVMGSWAVPKFKLTGRTKPEMAELVETLNSNEA